MKSPLHCAAIALLAVLCGCVAVDEEARNAIAALSMGDDATAIAWSDELADGSHYSQPTIWKELQDILEAAGLEHHRVHDLRHTFAVNSIRAGDDIKTLQENMGHYSAAFTLDRYGHVTETMRRESANRMQAFIENM